MKRRHSLYVSAAGAALAACIPAAQKTAVPGYTPALRPPLTYVALGASDAAGVGVEHPQRDSWVAVLAQRVPQPARLVNLGIPGVRLFEALEVELPPALEARPDLITIWLVVNDILTGISLDHYRADLDRLLGTLRARTGARIAIGNVPNAPDSLPYLGLPPAERRVVADSWNAAIAAVALVHGVTLVDLFRRWPLWDHPEYIGPDRLHPTVVGYQALAETFHAVLTEARIV
ncbi:MAG: SGNH/GDSL hydrolase family protein [Chloroflexota bacterium]